MCCLRARTWCRSSRSVRPRHSTSLVIPRPRPARYYIIAMADADNAVIESRETNNTQARAMQIGGDLIVSTVTAPAKAGADAPFAVADTTMNQGGGPVGPTVTKIYLSVNTALDAGDALVGSRAVSDLTAGAVNAGTAMVTSRRAHRRVRST